MTKKETIWRFILEEFFQKGERVFTQKNIAARFRFSISTVFNALRSPRKTGAVEVTGRFFRLRDAEKLLLLWAVCRNLEKDIVYRTRAEDLPLKIEGSMPAKVIFAAFSAYRLAYKSAPADYSEVYVYSENLAEIKKRFPQKNGTPNLFVLKLDPQLKSFGPTAPPSQIFADIWNIPRWYSKDFLSALRNKFNF